MGLSNTQQAILTLVAMTLIALGMFQVPLGLDPNVALVFVFLGLAGFGLKEALGSAYGVIGKLTNAQQAALMVASLALIAVSATQIPNHPYIALLFAVLG